MRARLVAALVALALLAAGVVVGVASVLVHHSWWGLPLLVAATATTAYALPPGWSTRLPFVAGWALAVARLMSPRAEGDYLVGADVAGYLLLGWGLALVVTGFATLPAPRRATPHRARRLPPPDHPSS